MKLLYHKHTQSSHWKEAEREKLADGWSRRQYPCYPPSVEIAVAQDKNIYVLMGHGQRVDVLSRGLERQGLEDLEQKILGRGKQTNLWEWASNVKRFLWYVCVRHKASTTERELNIQAAKVPNQTKADVNQTSSLALPRTGIINYWMDSWVEWPWYRDRGCTWP